MVKATINNFESLALSGKTLGNLTYSTRKSVGKRSNTDTAVVNINGSLDTLNIEPQAGFDFGMKSKTPLKLVNGKLLAPKLVVMVGLLLYKVFKVLCYHYLILPLMNLVKMIMIWSL